MLMPDVTFLLADPTIGAQDFNIMRRVGKWSGGRFVIIDEAAENVSAIGVIQPAGDESLQFFPEGERREGRIVIYTKTTIYLTEGSEISDEVEWQGEQYKIVSVTRWQEYGFNIAYACKR